MKANEIIKLTDLPIAIEVPHTSQYYKKTNEVDMDKEDTLYAFDNPSEIDNDLLNSEIEDISFYNNSGTNYLCLTIK